MLCRIGHGKGFHWIPVDQNKVLSDDMPIEENLGNIRAGILEDEFQPSTIKKFALTIEVVSFHLAHLRYLHTVSYLSDCRFVLLIDGSIAITGSHNSDSF
jgi:hypothetical protein